MVSFTFSAADLRPMTDDLMEGIRIGQKPALDVRIGAGCDQPLPDPTLGGVFDFGLLPQRRGTISIDGSDNELGWAPQYPLIDHSEIGTKLVQRVAMTSASRADPDPWLDSFLLRDPPNEGPNERLVGSVFDEEVDGERLIHR